MQSRTLNASDLPILVGQASQHDDRTIIATLARLDRLTRVLDSAVTIPGTGVRVGVDALIGLVPVIGDIAGKIISGYLILEARRLGVSKWTLARMATNTMIDMLIGSVPLIGDMFDVLYRANQRNAALLRRHIQRQQGQQPGSRVNV
jgi:hypothetical protein